MATILEFDKEGDGSVWVELQGDCRFIECRRGEDNASMVIGRSSAGRLNAVLNNDEGRYSPFETGSDLYGKMIPGRRIRLRVTSPVAAVLWTGVLDSAPRPEMTARSSPTAVVTAAGIFVQLAGENNRVSAAALANASTGEIIDAILDEAEFPLANRDIETGTVEVTRWFEDDIEALNAMRKVEDTEVGFLYEGLDWDVVFEARYSRDINSLVSQATFSDAPAAALNYQAIDEADPLRELFNVINVQVQSYGLGAEAELWHLAETVVLGPGESRTYFAQASTSGGVRVAYVDPWVSVDIVRDSSVSNFFPLDPVNPTVENLGDVEVTVTPFAATAKVDIENIDVAAHTVTELLISGVPVLAGQPFRVEAEDVASKAIYGRRTYPQPGPWYSNSAYAEGAAAYVLSKTKDPHPVLAVHVIGVDSASLTQIYSRVISDRITLIADNRSKLGISQDFYIESIAFRLDPHFAPSVLWELSPAFDDPGYWILEVSDDLGVDTVLAF